MNDTHATGDSHHLQTTASPRRPARLTLRLSPQGVFYDMSIEGNPKRQRAYCDLAFEYFQANGIYRDDLTIAIDNAGKQECPATDIWRMAEIIRYVERLPMAGSIWPKTA